MTMKELCVSTDYMSDLLHPRIDRHFDKDQLNQLMAYSASLGAKRHEWVADTWLLSEELGGSAENPAGFDYLAAACEAAHANGLRFDVVFKPFEGLMPQQMTPFPETFPQPDGVPTLEHCGAFHHSVRPFLAQNPHLRLSRSPADIDPGKPIAEIRLIRNDDAPAGFDAADISIWTSQINGGPHFEEYKGPVSFKDTLEWRPYHPKRDQRFRVITLAGLQLPESARYIKVCCGKQGLNFVNESERMIELADAEGQLIPTTPSAGPVKAEKLWEMSQLGAKLGLSHYLLHPEIKELLQDKDRFMSLCAGSFSFGITNQTTFGDGNELAIMRGKPRYVAGSLHPIYAEVREHWLDLIRFCLDRGVDGVNIRVANHNRPFEQWSYSFNDRVVAQMENAHHTGEAAHINGEAYSQFLREASELIRGRGKEMGVHMHMEFFNENTGGKNGPVPRNYIWQWERWIREFADYVEFRGAATFEPDLKIILGRIARVTREAGIPLMLQSTRMTARDHYDSDNPVCAYEMQWVRDDPEIAIYNLYETVSFTRLNDSGKIEGSDQISGLVSRYWNQ